MAAGMQEGNRRIHVYGVGGAKTGTHSLAAMFAGSFRSVHEPGAAELIAMNGRRLRGEVGADEFDQWLLARDRRLALEVDVSCLNGWLALRQAELFPRSRFILTLREPFGWLDSLYSQQLLPSPDQHWRDSRRQAFGPLPARYPAQEAWLAERGLHPIAACIRYWSERNLLLLDGLPRDRLFVLLMRDLRLRAAELASFCGVDAGELALERSHQFRGNGQVQLSQRLDLAYVRGQVLLAGRPLLQRCFPKLLARLETEA